MYLRPTRAGSLDEYLDGGVRGRVPQQRHHLLLRQARHRHVVHRHQPVARPQSAVRHCSTLERSLKFVY